MKSISNTELKEIELNILLAVAEYCEKNNLQYFLAYGTLIGAVRHSGFIPWDDDVDIMMPRKDYNYLINHFNEDMAGTPYHAIIPFSEHSRHTILKIGDNRTIKREPEYRYTNDTKAGMIDIDVFPLDGVPEELSQYKIWYKNLYALYNSYFLKIRTFKNLNIKSKIKIFIKKVSLFFSTTKESIMKKTHELHNKYPFDECNYVGCVECCWNSGKNHFKKELFLEYELLSFCNHELRVPVGYDEVLRSLYGDYMKLPPKEAQVPMHSMDIFWKE